MKCRRGFTLIEVSLALSIVTVPALFVFNLLQANTAGTRLNQERLSAHVMLNDLAGLLDGEKMDRLRELAQGDTEGLDALLEGRVAGIPEPSRTRFRAQIQDLFGHVKLSMEEDVEGIPGLARLELSASLSHGASTSLCWLIRPAARVTDHADATAR